MNDNVDNRASSPEEMKAQALLERVAQITAEYENKIADLRAAYTMSEQAREQAETRLAEYEAPAEPSE